MKKTIFFLACLFALLQMQAQTHRINESDSRHISMTIQTGELQVRPVLTDNGLYSELTIDGCANTIENVGEPQLPMITKMIEIPVCGDIHVTATAGSVRTMTAYEAGIQYDFLPTQPQYHKSFTGEKTFAKNNATYTHNADYGMPLATVSKGGIARNVCLATVSIYPVQVNPVTKMVTIYDDITVTVTYDNADMAATRELKLKYASAEFSAPAELVNTIEVPGLRDAMTTTPVKYLIIANDMFDGQFTSFVNWKRRKGYLVEVAYTGTIGTTTTAIKNYITTLFNNATAENPAPTYVLLVGDQAQLPAYSGQTLNSHITDLYYFTQVGSDVVPDCYWGRFSAQTTAHLRAEIDKTLAYEQLTMPDLSYLDNALLVAGEDGGSSGDYGYSHANPAMHYLEDTYGDDFFTSITSFYNPHASSNATSIRNALNGGIGYANYSAHCSSTGWSIPSFSTTNANAMTNTNKFGIMIGNCCQSNKFDESECFGEALLRGSSKGAVGYIGGTDYTYWHHDYYWAVGARGTLSTSCTNCNTATYDASNLGAYDCLFHTHNEAYSNWFVTQGSMIYCGNMAVQNVYGSTNSYVKYYWEIYELMGDPSVMPWLGQPAAMNISINGTPVTNEEAEIIDGATTLTVSTGAPYSYVALTQDLNLITAVLTDANGNATLTFPAVYAGTTYELAASAQNYRTTFTTINVAAAEGARVRITNAETSNNAQATAGANITLDVTIANSFPDAATNTVITAATSSNQITLTDANETVGTFAGQGNTQTLNAAFGLTIGNNIADGDIANINFTVSFLNNGAPETTTYSYDLVLVDAKLVHISDSYAITTGNGDATVDPGETVTFTIVDKNEGHCTAPNIVSQLSTYYNLAPVTNGSISAGNIAVSAQYTSTFTVSIGNDVPVGTMIPYCHRIYSTTNSALEHIDTLWLMVGSVNAVEDWESGDMTQFEWTSEGSYPWELVNSGAYAGTYCARSTNYHVNSSVSDMSLTINVPTDGVVSYYRKVSSETNYDFFKFYIDGEEKESQSGTSNWTQKTYDITAGQHTLKFTFEKDVNTNSGSDRAWVDNITFPTTGTIAPVPEGIEIVSAGLNGGTSANEGESVQFNTTLRNSSDQAISNVTLTMSTTSSDLTLTDATETISTVAANSEIPFSSIFAGNIANNVANGTVVNCTVTAEYVANNASASQTHYFSFIVNSGELDIISHSVAITSGNGDEDINPGESIQVTMTTNNIGTTALNNVISALTTTSPYAAITNGTQTITTIAADGSATTTFTVNIAENTPDNTAITFTNTASASIHGNDTYTFTLNVVVPPFVALSEVSHNHSIISGNGDNDINQGETVRFNIYTRNEGNAAAHNAVSVLTTESEYATISNANQQIGTINANTTVSTQFDVAIAENTPDNTLISFTHYMYSDEDTCSVTFTINVIEFTGVVTLTDVNHSVSILTGNNDDIINPGETIKVTVYSRNDGNVAAQNLASTLMTTSAFAAIENPVVNFATAATGAMLTSQYNVSIDNTTPSQTVIPFTHLITDGTNSATSEFEITVIVDGSGIAENGNSIIAVYPNPTSGLVNVVMPMVSEQFIRIYDVYGREVLNQRVSGETTTIDLSAFADGIYTLRVIQDNGSVATAKIVKR